MVQQSARAQNRQQAMMTTAGREVVHEIIIQALGEGRGYEEGAQEQTGEPVQH